MGNTGEIEDSFSGMLRHFKIHHIIFWAFYYIFWIFVYRSFYEDFTLLLKVTVVYLISHSGIYYFSQYYLVPRLLKKHEALLFVLSFILLCIVVSFAMYLIILLIMGRSPESIFQANFFQILSIFLLNNFLMGGIMLGIKGYLDSRSLIQLNERLEKERLESELQFLKSQVNPHFLFNAINSVYVLIKINPELASETLIKLSNLLRSQLYDFAAEKIEIGLELDYLRNYLELEKIRKGDRVDIVFEEWEGSDNFFIAPLILIPFLENCFKHLSTHTDRPNLVKVKIESSGDYLHAYFYNTTEAKDKNMARNIGGIGLVNIRRRLDLLYPKSHWLQIEALDESYEVNLKIKLR